MIKELAGIVRKKDHKKGKTSTQARLKQTAQVPPKPTAAELPSWPSIQQQWQMFTAFRLKKHFDTFRTQQGGGRCPHWGKEPPTLTEVLGKCGMKGRVHKGAIP